MSDLKIGLPVDTRYCATIDSTKDVIAAPTILNAANEVAVEAFLKKIIPFTQIPIIIDSALHSWRPKNPSNIDDILAIDAEIRIKAKSLLPRS